MFELLLDAMKLALSKDARENAAALIELFRHSPDWQKDICTLEARIGHGEAERAWLVRDLLVAKLDALSFPDDCRRQYATTFTELARNAFEHGGRTRSPVRVVADTSSTFIATVFFNARHHAPDLPKALRDARERLASDPAAASGRGLLLASEHADELTIVEPKGIKAVFYQDRVRIVTKTVRGILLVSIAAGHLNPSVTRRLMTFLERDRPAALILVLDAGLDGPRTTAIGNAFSQIAQQSAPAPPDIESALPRPRRHLPRSDFSGPPSTAIGPVVSLFSSRKGLWRLVCEDPAMRSLLPVDIVHARIAEASQAILATISSLRSSSP